MSSTFMSLNFLDTFYLHYVFSSICNTDLIHLLKRYSKMYFDFPDFEMVSVVDLIIKFNIENSDSTFGSPIKSQRNQRVRNPLVWICFIKVMFTITVPLGKFLEIIWNLIQVLWRWWLVGKWGGGKWWWKPWWIIVWRTEA